MPLTKGVGEMTIPERSRCRQVVAFLFSISLILALGSATLAQGQGNNNKGGFGDEGAGCASFRDSFDDSVRSDGGGVYCNGTDGQVSVPKRFRIDLKKFNSNKRTIIVEPYCAGADGTLSLCLKSFQGEIVLQSLKEYVGGQEQDGDLDFQSIGLDETRHAGLTIAFQFNRKNSFALSYGNDTSSDFSRCPTFSASEPVSVTCTAVNPDSGNCAAWFVEGGKACLKDALSGDILDDDVTARFGIELFVQ
jgi:hypothetical protein